MRGGPRPGAGRPPGSVSAAPRIREAFLTALDEMEAEGTPLVGIIKAQLKESPLATLKVLAAFESRVVDASSSQVSLPDLLEQVEEEWARQRASF